MRQLVNKETNARHERSCNIDCLSDVDHTLPAQLHINEVNLSVAYKLVVLLTRFGNILLHMGMCTARRINSAATRSP